MFSLSRRRRFLMGTATAALVAAAVAIGCSSSTANDPDSCQSLEYARCDKLAACPGGIPGGAQSCENFYQVQCGRGLQDTVQPFTKAQLTACISAIKASCDVAADPSLSPACAGFLALTPTDGGVDAATETESDTGSVDAGANDTADVDATTTDDGATNG
jgi:hypothetical protein